MSEPGPLVFTAPPSNGNSPRYLTLAGPGAERFTFYDQIEIGREVGGRERAPGLLLIPDPTVSRRHCVVTQTAGGRCLIRDLSRNGTRLNGRRMVPNVEYPIEIGDSFAVTSSYEFVLGSDEQPRAQTRPPTAMATIGMAETTIATVLVGDIRDYTVLVRRAPSGELQQSVSRVFETLSRVVGQQGGTVKEFQGDAIMAFWEGSLTGEQAASACRAAIVLDRVARRIADDPEIWNVGDFRLQMDWALATGTVSIDAFGGTERAGLSLIGEPVVLAFRIEKFCDDETGRIIVCPTTRAMAGPDFRFRDLGEKLAKGFDRPERVYALQFDDQAAAPGSPR